ncbi:MAG TPA: hypothetical protein VNQ78_07240 [Paracoccus sp. (in: a-proteobacteria)]|uniref:hypothetical protein n=1 Tax=Paracoccus sp. TaxID=267 RepID=UPI002B56B616|nr:hypothetical protein [Paracoccus sp. (in: a-proteobacteria)]HWL56458.1 hypothetical protein [Paracoccus sp. (in: a-proteobacteria)]
MIVIAALIFGAAVGWWRAARLGGTRADRMQYGAAHALAFAILGIFLTILIARSG